METGGCELPDHTNQTRATYPTIHTPHNTGVCHWVSMETRLEAEVNQSQHRWRRYRDLSVPTWLRFRRSSSYVMTTTLNWHSNGMGANQCLTNYKPSTRLY
ncbi:hypothetical protein BaRGS_00038105 [Batillaria attramentaria]|uniref:Uncharacterized protein n=1 Tax=Batillaria attramentaria TaxID=370345 RepID=A0ABD0J6S4_9CAEN